MPNIFISYENRSLEVVEKLTRALRVMGFDGVVYDKDARNGLHGGDDWKPRLRMFASTSKVSFFLVTPEWLESKFGVAEFIWASLSGRPRIPISLDPRKPDKSVDVPESISGTRHSRELIKEGLVEDERGALNYLKALQWEAIDPNYLCETGKLLNEELNSDEVKLQSALRKRGLVPKSFPFDIGSYAPYPGMAAMGREHAGVFTGRDVAIDEFDDAVTNARRFRFTTDKHEKRLIVCQAQSGVGKTSFLQAGLLRRLELKDDEVHALPIVRPAERALTGRLGLVRSLHSALEIWGPRRAPLNLAPFDFDTSIESLERSLQLSTGGQSLVEVLTAIQETATEFAFQLRHSPTLPQLPVNLLLFVDQGEELFPDQHADPLRVREAERVQFLLGEALSASLNKAGESSLDDLQAIVAIFMRSDTISRLQSNDALGKGRFHRHALFLDELNDYDNVISFPARHRDVELNLDIHLVDALKKDVQGEGDALPLIAFVLGRLWETCVAERYQGTDRQGRAITLEDYNEVAGRARIGGVIQLAVGEALNSLVLGLPLAEQHDRLRRIFVPALVWFEAREREFFRRIENEAEFNEANGFDETDRAIIEALVNDARILTRSGGKDGAATLEVTHEAVLRSWPLLKGWLDEAKEALSEIRNAEDYLEQLNKRVAELEANGHDLPKWAALAELPFEQARRDALCEAFAQVGLRPNSDRVHRLRSLVSPKQNQLIEELSVCTVTAAGQITPFASTERRTGIGVALNELGDLRPGVGILSQEYLRNIEKDRAFRDCFSLSRDFENEERIDSILTNFEHGWKLLPDIAWCAVPPGEVALKLDLQPTGEPTGASQSFKVQRPFFIAKYPLTIAQYYAFACPYVDGEFVMKGRKEIYSDTALWDHLPGIVDSSFTTEIPPPFRPEKSAQQNQPAQYIDWFAGVAFGKWLTKRYRSLGLIGQNDEVRLPTEWEWVQAATGGQNIMYPWGSDWNDGLLSHNVEGGATSAAAVGLYPFGNSPTGAADMSGLAHEWCLNHCEDLEKDPYDDVMAELRPTRGGASYTRPQSAYGLDDLQPRFAVSVHGRLLDPALGKGKDGQKGNVLTAVRLMCTGFTEKGLRLLLVETQAKKIKLGAAEIKVSGAAVPSSS